MYKIDLNELFFPDPERPAACGIKNPNFIRTRIDPAPGISIVLDRFSTTSAQAVFLRISGSAVNKANIGLSGGYKMESCSAGGWLLQPNDVALDTFWIPQFPTLRHVDSDLHIRDQKFATTEGLSASANALDLTFVIPNNWLLDVVVWRLPGNEADWTQGLQALSTIESQRYFLWSSHTTYARPADLYLHLVHGHVYENHVVWPKYWRVCSELDAYGLYVTLSGLLRATGKRWYALLRTQVVFSVIDRQSDDGGWYHGEWTDHMESHYRLHAGAIHLLAAYYQEFEDPVVRKAMDMATDFAASRTDNLIFGKWFLHDSLEENDETLKGYPFRIAPSRALGKSNSNLLVLNTHLDTNIAMQRYRIVTNDPRHDDLIASATATSRAVIALRPMEWLYRPLYWLIGLTFLPTAKAKHLPLPLRALKRIAWKYLTPWLPRIKSRFPRLVMPGGFIERDIAQYGISVRYQPVNLMDLIRTRRIFQDSGMDAQLRACFTYTIHSGLTRRWKDAKGSEDDSLGFWAEALYHLCLSSSQVSDRARLVEAILDLEDNQLGLTPSILGSNAEAIPPRMQHPCPISAHAGLRVVNLSQGDRIEWLIVNPGNLPITLEWSLEPGLKVVWQTGDGTMPAVNDGQPVIAARGWLRGMPDQP
jgi:hypothetical protein